jgi:EpsI family protein
MGTPLSSVFHSRAALIATVLLLGQAGFYYGRAKNPERIPLVRPLSTFPSQVSRWTLAQEGVVEDNVKAVLQADDLLNRYYVSPGVPRGANLFVAYFKTQRRGVRPHSPLNCLPGSGWEPTTTSRLTIPIPGQASIQVKKVIVRKGEARHLVLYWYQSAGRAVPGELEALLHAIADAARYNRTDTAIVRVFVPVLEGDEQQAEKEGAAFVQAIYPHLLGFFPA